MRTVRSLTSALGHEQQPWLWAKDVGNTCT